MPLQSIQPNLHDARNQGFAVPLFDAFDSRSVDGMFTAAEERNAPVIIALYATSMDGPNADALAAYILARAKGGTVQCSFMLDHGRTPAECLRAMDMGATDVMLDASRLPYDENLSLTKGVVREAHSRGIGVEAELGHVGLGRDYQDFGSRRKWFTDPDDAVRFVRESGVDSLAVAIGTAHGQYDGEPALDLELLGELRSSIDVPLVLHGGSGLSEDQYKSSILAGISKINIATELYATAGARLVSFAAEGGSSYHEFGKTAEESFANRCGSYFDVFGASGRGGA
jgi:fructose-bisphosphate aldolase class II